MSNRIITKVNIELNTNYDISPLGGRWQEVSLCIAGHVCIESGGGKCTKSQSLIVYSSKFTMPIFKNKGYTNILFRNREVNAQSYIKKK